MPTKSTSGDTALRIYATPVPAGRRITTLLHGTRCRTALAWKNTAYNRPPHPGFFIGSENGHATTPGSGALRPAAAGR